MSYKPLQVLRTNKATRSVQGTKLPVNTRVVVVRHEGKIVTARVADPKVSATGYIALPDSMVSASTRGRPRISAAAAESMTAPPKRGPGRPRKRRAQH